MMNASRSFRTVFTMLALGISLAAIGCSDYEAIEGFGGETPRPLPPPHSDIPDADYVKVIGSGFEEGTYVEFNQAETYATIKGTDNSFPTPNSWDTFNQTDLYFSILVDGYQGRSQWQITNDPVQADNKVFQTRVLDVGKENKNGRAQAQFMMYNDRESYSVYRVRYRQFISEDYRLLADLTSFGNSEHWTDFFEVWSPVPEQQEPVMNEAGAFRIHFAFQPDLKGGFEWSLGGENMCGTEEEVWQGWSRTNASYEVPFGKWCEWEVYIALGPDPKTDPESPARVIVNMRPEGEQEWVTLFDVRDERTVHSRIAQKGLYQYSPFKNYLGPQTVRHLLDRGAQNISFYFDDIEFWVVK